MWNTAESKTPQPTPANTIQPPAPSLGEIARVVPSAKQTQHSFIGKSIVIKGEITSSDPLYVEGRVEGSIIAPEQRVTVGKDGKLKADVSAREVVVMGDVCGNLNGRDRVEIRTDGSLTGDLTADRICIEDGAFLKGGIDVRKRMEEAKADAPEEPYLALEPREAVPAAEQELDHRTWGNLAVADLG